MGIDKARKHRAILEEDRVINFIARRAGGQLTRMVADKCHPGVEAAVCVDQIRQPSY
jgi:hypothetical protein